MVGVLVGLTPAVQVVSTLVTGPLIDRFGSRQGLRIGPTLHLAASLILLTASRPELIGTARVLQGASLALVLPAAFSLTPSLASARYRATAFGIVGVMQNLALAAGPPLGLWLLARGPRTLFVTATVSAVLGLGLSLSMRVGGARTSSGRMLKFRASWIPLYAATFLTVLYFGPVLAFLPIYVAQQHGGNVGWFFSADALAVLLLRVPTGYVADRVGPRWLLLSGILVTAVATLPLLTLSPALEVLILSGALAGIGAALLYPPILLELTARSDETDRGTAMALYSSSFAGALSVGSLAGALTVVHFGFRATLVFGILCSLAALPVVLATVGRREDG